MTFTWNAFGSSPDHYRLRSDLVNSGVFADASTTGFVVVPDSNNINPNQRSVRADIALHRYIPLLNGGAQYRVEACDGSNNCPDFVDNDLNKTQLNQLIGVIDIERGYDYQFGSTLSLSADGNTLAIGASADDDDSTGVNNRKGNENAGQSGAVYGLCSRQ